MLYKDGGGESSVRAVVVRGLGRAFLCLSVCAGKNAPLCPVYPLTVPDDARADATLPERRRSVCSVRRRQGG